MRTALLLLLTACGHSEKDTALVCLGPIGTEVSAIDADAPITLWTTPQEDCLQDAEVTCEIDLDGDTLVVKTHTAWSGSGDCDVVPEGTCTSPPLAAGTYTLVYGDDTVTLQVPGTAAGCLPRI